MSESDVVERVFDRVLSDEPAMHLQLGAVLMDGQRIRRRHRLAYAAVATTMTLAAAGAGIAYATHRTRPARVTAVVTPFVPLAGSAARAPRTPASSLTAQQQAIAAAIRGASPAGWTFEMGADRWEGTSVEGTADDGAGPGRLTVGISAGPDASQLLYPCRESEFAAGVSCTERVLPDGSVLSMRGAFTHDGITALEAVLTHPDGSGVMAESGNFTLTWPMPRVVTSAEEKRNLVHRSRSGPTYTTDQLARVVMAVSAAAE
jgi:hypothetical protein